MSNHANTTCWIFLPRVHKSILLHLHDSSPRVQKKTLPLLDLPEMRLICCWATVCACVCACPTCCISAFLSLEDWQTVPGMCQGVYFSLLGASGCRRLCFVPSALFGLSVTPVRPYPNTTAAGWVHTLAINLSLLCALMGVCVDTC